MANVIIASQKTRKVVTIENFEGTTARDLKEHSDIAPLLSDSVDIIVSPGNHSLVSDSSTLPEGDFKVFLIEKKNKAGQVDSDEIGDAIVNAIDEAAEERDIRTTEALKSALIKTINDFFDTEVTVDDMTESTRRILDEADRLFEELS